MAILSEGYATWGCFFVVVLSLVPGVNRPHSELLGWMEHFLVYAGTGLILPFTDLAFHQRLSWIALSCASCVLEVLQRFAPGRNRRSRDAMAGMAGLTVGMIFGTALTVEMRGEAS